MSNLYGLRKIGFLVLFFASSAHAGFCDWAVEVLPSKYSQIVHELRMEMSSTYRAQYEFSTGMAEILSKFNRGELLPSNEVESYLAGHSSGEFVFDGYKLRVNTRTVGIDGQAKQVLVVVKVESLHLGSKRYPSLLWNLEKSAKKYNLDGLLIENVTGDGPSAQERQIQFYLRNGFKFYGDPKNPAPSFYRLSSQ